MKLLISFIKQQSIDRLHLWSLWPLTCVLGQPCVHFQLSVAYRSGCLPQIPPVTIFIWLRNFRIFIFWTLDKREYWSLMISPFRWFDINERFPQLIVLRTRVFWLACENIHFSLLFADGDVSHGGTYATQRQKFHTDDVKSVWNPVRSADWSTE